MCQRCGSHQPRHDVVPVVSAPTNNLCIGLFYRCLCFFKAITMSKNGNSFSVGGGFHGKRQRYEFSLCDGRWDVNVLLTTLIWSFHHWLVEEASVAGWPKAWIWGYSFILYLGRLLPSEFIFCICLKCDLERCLEVKGS